MGRDMREVLKIADLYKRFQGIVVLRGVSLSLRRGGITALIGSNGAGKSTLLNLVSGALEADRGAIYLNGHDVSALPGFARARLGLARTFQHPRVFASLTVLESVRFAATAPREDRLLRNLASAPADAEERLHESLRLCGLEHKSGVPAGELSYGEQKLLMLAQVLANDAQFLCFDELCAGLEPAVVDRVKEMFRTLVALGKSILFIEHNLELVRELAEWVVFLHSGEVFRQGETNAVLEDPEVVRLYLGQ